MRSALLLVGTLRESRCCCSLGSLARVGVAEHFRSRRSRLRARNFLIRHVNHLLSISWGWRYCLAHPMRDYEQRSNGSEAMIHVAMGSILQ